MADETKEVEEEDDGEFGDAFAEAATAYEKAGDIDHVPGDVGTGGDTLDWADSETEKQDEGKQDPVTPQENEDEFGQSFNQAAQGTGAAQADKTEQPEDLADRLKRQDEEIEKLRQSERSQRGRVSALTKKLVEQRAAVKPPEVPGKSEAEANDNGDWEEFQREFPEMAAIVDKRLSKVDSKIDRVDKAVGAVSTTQETLVEKELLAYKDTQFDILKDKHKDLDEVKASPEWAEWKKAAPPEVIAGIKSHHADDAVKVIDRFKAETGFGAKAQPAVKSDIEKLNERRAAALKQSAGISSKKVGHSTKQDTGSDDDFAAGFEARSKKIERGLSRRF